MAYKFENQILQEFQKKKKNDEWKIWNDFGANSVDGTQVFQLHERFKAGRVLVRFDERSERHDQPQLKC